MVIHCFCLFSASNAMPAPLVTFQNSTQVKIQWDPQSFHAGGPIKRFELKVLSQRTNEEFTIEDVAPTATYSLVRLDHIKDNLAPDCAANNSKEYFYGFSIRSVTKDDSDNEFVSPWSPSETVQGYCPGNYQSHSFDSFSWIKTRQMATH